MEIRAARPDEVPAIERLSLEAFPHLHHILPHLTFDALLDALIRLRLTNSNPTEGIFVADDGGEIVGIVFADTADQGLASLRSQWAIVRPLGLRAAVRILGLLRYRIYRPRKHEAYLNGIAVKPGQRRSGLGLGLMAAAEDYARACGKQLACGFVASANTASRGVMRTSGWAEVPHRSLFGRIRSRRTGLLRVEKVL